MAEAENIVVANCRKKASQLGLRLFRNNRGQFYTMDKKRIVRAGLEANGSSDLIGIAPIKITAEMIGMTLGVFVGAECKEPEWKFNPNDEHEEEQENFNEQIRKLGGIAFFIKYPENLGDLIKEQIEEKIFKNLLTNV